MKNSIKSASLPKVDTRRMTGGSVRRSRHDSRLVAHSDRILKNLSNPFLSGPTETHFLPTPASVPIGTTLMEGDQEIFIEPTTPAAPDAIHSISREIVRDHFEHLLKKLADPNFDAEVRIEQLHTELGVFQSELRARDLSRPMLLAKTAADRMGEQPVSSMDAGAARQFATTLKAAWKAELTALEEFEDPLSVASGLLARFHIEPQDGQIPPFVSISRAVEVARQGKSEEMRRKLDATGSLLIEFFGDISLDLVPKRIVEFSRFLHRMPRDHGQKHGKNRYKSEGTAFSKRDLILASDTHDAECYAQVRTLPGASERQQLAMLPDLLSIRMTQTNLERHLDRVHEILRAAAKKLGYSGATKALSYSELSQEMKTFDQELRKVEALFLRVMRPKIRARWSGVRLKKMLTSPLYRGCFSKSRRTRTGKTLIRDALYWIPLIVMTMGTRLTEVLQLKSGDLIWHEDGVYCLRFAWSVEQNGKRVASRRVVPIPQVLLELGFVEWIRKKSFDPNTLLFSEIFKKNPRFTDQTFTKRFWTVRKNLELLNHSEDFYALRMTLSSALWRGGVSESDRQMIIGHASKTIIGKHYTFPDMKVLKSMLDLADFKLKICNSRVHGFPLIADCKLISGAPANVEVVLDVEGAVGAVRVTREVDGKQLAGVYINSSAGLCAPKWKGMDRVSRERAAQVVHDLTTDCALIPPGNSAQADAFEQFMAFGKPAASGVEVEGLDATSST